MKIRHLGLGLVIMLQSITTAYANDSGYMANPVRPSISGSPDDETSKLLKRLGAYLGYDLDKDASAYEFLLDPSYTVASTGVQILDIFFGSIPVNSNSPQFSSNSTFQSFNDMANSLFTNYHSPNSGDASVISGLDQSSGSKGGYQNDPVSQSLYNLLGTPGMDTCSSTTNPPCINQVEVTQKVLEDVSDKGTLPGPSVYYNADNISKYVNQLNVNTLLAPLVYTTTPTSADNSGQGLPGANQAQQAIDFVRYATAGVNPMDTMSFNDYYTLWTQANQSTDNKTTAELELINSSKAQLASYLVSMRVYAAQSSVAISNLYGVLSKRMPQTVPSADGKSNTTSSEALSEFQTATWRLYNPSEKNSDNQWVNLINQSSAATVEKEMAILLSEINYQLYLNRQMEEKNLLTKSLLLVQSLMSNKPNPAPLNGQDNPTLQN